MILEDLLQGLLELICSLFYGMFSGICLLIDFIKTIFYKLCGIETVEIEVPPWRGLPLPVHRFYY